MISIKRPRESSLLALALVLVALSMPVQAFIIYEHEWHESAEVLAKMTTLNWMVFASCLMCAVLVFRVSRWSHWALAAVTGLVALNNFAVGYAAVDYSPWTAFFATVFFAALNLPLWRKEVLELCAHPEKRLWSRPERRRIQVPIVIDMFRKTPLKSETFDLSETGVFVPTGTDNLRVNDEISLRMTFGAFSQIRCEGRVVRRDGAKGRYPAGVGIQFTHMHWRHKRELRRHLQSKFPN